MTRVAAALLLAWSLAGPVVAQEPAVDVKAVLGEPRGPRLTGAELDRETAEVAELLRCPVCQGLSVADSPAPMAVNMRGQVHDMLAQGYTGEQVLSYFESSYGEFVRLEPDFRGINWLVWVAPLLGLVAGGVVVRRMMRQRGAAPAAVVPGGGAESLPDDPRLAAAVLKVREMAYGWPGGRRP